VSQLEEIQHAAATMIAGLGDKIPTYIGGLGFRERVIAVSLLDSETPFPDAVYEVFITHPEKIAQLMLIDPALAALIRKVGATATAEMLTWPKDKVLTVFAALVDLTVSRGKPAHAEASRNGGGFAGGAPRSASAWGDIFGG
jgi:hypothetical protein